MRRLADIGVEFPEFLQDPCPGLRRAAARSLRSNEHLSKVEVAFYSERTEEGRCVLGGAVVRCGGSQAEVEVELARVQRRRLATFGGWREPEGEALVERFRLGLGGASEIRERLRAGCEEKQDLVRLAALQETIDFPLVLEVRERLGRRGDHGAVAALGLSGDPRSLPILHDILFATDVDPGRGFVQRRLCAVAMGRIGLMEALPWLERALRYEALDYEGRPGAGLGIQYPVRTDILWAMGEVAHSKAAQTLVGYLGNTHGSALGGFYLVAMDALTKLGPGILPGLVGEVGRAPEVVAANLVGVIAALGGDTRPFLQDGRPLVAGVARLVGEG